MEAIKKKMQNMKLEKDNAMDRADACEQQAKDANIRAEKAQEEVLLLIFFLWMVLVWTLVCFFKPLACANLAE